LGGNIEKSIIKRIIPLSPTGTPIFSALINKGVTEPFEKNNTPQLKVFGKTYGEWSAEWVKWAITSKGVAIDDTSGASCGANQPKNGVWFLAGTFGVNADRTCTIPANRMLFYPLIEASWVDCPGTSDITTSDADVRAGLAGYIDLAGELTTTVDGISIAGLQMLTVRVQSPKFTSIIPTNFTNDSCSPHLSAGKSGRQIVDGYWVMLPPLSIGQHDLTLHGSAIFPDGTKFENSVNYELNVTENY